MAWDLETEPEHQKMLAFGPVIDETMKSAADLAESTEYGK